MPSWRRALRPQYWHAPGTVVHAARRQPRVALPQRWHGGSGALDQHFAKIFAPALGDSKEPRLAAGRLLPWHEAEPCGEITAAGEGTCISDGCDKSRRVQRPNAGNGDQPPRMLVLAGCWTNSLSKRHPLSKQLPALSHVTDEFAVRGLSASAGSASSSASRAASLALPWGTICPRSRSTL